MISHRALQALQALLMSNCRPAKQPARPAASARLSCARLSLAQGAGPPAASFEKRRYLWGAASQGWIFWGGAARVCALRVRRAASEALAGPLRRHFPGRDAYHVADFSCHPLHSRGRQQLHPPG